jgi:hypothetical protein
VREKTDLATTLIHRQRWIGATRHPWAAQLTLGRMVKCTGDHVRLLDNLPNGATLAQEIVASSVFPITEILVIEDHKLNSTLVSFRSQSLLKPTGDQTSSDTN